jgi:hypothetical protein
VIIDLRPASHAPFVVLTGLERALYRECDAVRDLWSLERTVAALGEADGSGLVERVLAPLVEGGLMLRDGGRYLALAIPMGEYAPSRSICEGFSELVRECGEPDRSGWVVPTTCIGTGIGAIEDKPRLRARRATRGGAAQLPLPSLTACEFSVDARGRLVIQAGERPRQTRRSRDGQEVKRDGGPSGQEKEEEGGQETVR